MQHRSKQIIIKLRKIAVAENHIAHQAALSQRHRNSFCQRAASKVNDLQRPEVTNRFVQCLNLQSLAFQNRQLSEQGEMILKACDGRVVEVQCSGRSEMVHLKIKRSQRKTGKIQHVVGDT